MDKSPQKQPPPNFKKVGGANDKPRPAPPRVETKQDTLRSALEHYTGRATGWIAPFTRALDKEGLASAIEWNGEEAATGDVMLRQVQELPLLMNDLESVEGLANLRAYLEAKHEEFSTALTGAPGRGGRGPWHPNSTSLMANAVKITRANALREGVALCYAMLAILDR